MPTNKKTKSTTTAKATATKKVTLDARPDSLDFRDLMYVPTLVEVPPHRLLADYRQVGNPILDQGTEGACTGFGLAAVANYLFLRLYSGGRPPVSPRMFYEMAKRYDEWPGENYDGSSARGAMKGWHKHGVCGDSVWPYQIPQSQNRLTPERSADALQRPLGAYFRVNHKDLVSMHSAITEVGILYATSSVHDGWNAVGSNGMIRFKPGSIGGHAFAIVGYDQDGFWIQNSWGPSWGRDGYAHLSYDDWLTNGFDVWVARLGVPVRVDMSLRTYAGPGAVTSISTPASYEELRPHVVLLGNDGQLRPDGTFGNDEKTLDEIVNVHFPRITEKWNKKRILIYAHGGLTSENSALERVSDYREHLLENQIYPISIVWRSGFWETLQNILREAVSKRRSEGVLDSAKDFILDRLDDALEPLARTMLGKAQWDEMKENALRATETSRGGARLLADRLAALAGADSSIEFHLAGHSAGSIVLAPFSDYFTGSTSAGGKNKGLGQKIDSLTLWAPACTTEVFKRYYKAPLSAQKIRLFKLVNLTDRAEQDDHCAHIYRKSLLYLVSHAFEEVPRIPWTNLKGTALLGLDKDVRGDQEISQLLKKSHCRYATAPNSEPTGSADASNATCHGDFDDDEATVKGLLTTIIGSRKSTGTVSFERTTAGKAASRRELSENLQRPY